MNMPLAESVLKVGREGRRKLSWDFAQITLDLVPVADFLSVMLAGYLGTLLYGLYLAHSGTPAGYWAMYRMEIVLAAIAAALVLHERRRRYVATRMRISRVMQRTAFRFLLLAAAALAVAFASRTVDTLPRGLAALWLGLGLSFVLISRLGLISHLRLLERGGILTETVAIVGAGALADRLIGYLRRQRQGSLDIVGVFDDRVEHDERRSALPHFRPNGTVRDLIELGKCRKIDWILVTIPGDAEGRLLATLHQLKTLAVPVGLCPQNVGMSLPCRSVNWVGDGVPVMLLADRPIRRWSAVVKSAEDLVLGGLLVLALAPLMGLIALGIRLEGPGPVLFRQKRHTANNGVFEVLKFRTMRWDPRAAAGPLRQTGVDDDRITRFGSFLRKSSLDELPQLFNVLRGQMSLVGPRPHAVNMRTEERLGHEIIDAYPHRHRVKPGMTGWAQVNGSRGATETAEQLRRRVELDLHYVENWSLLLDLKILVMTFWVVLRGTNAR